MPFHGRPRLARRAVAVLAVLGVVVNTWGAVAFRGYSW